MPQYTPKDQYNITDGPSKFDLMLSLFDWSSSRKSVYFTTDIGRLEVNIVQVGAEDGSGESWLIKGNLINQHESLPDKMEGYFETRRRTGWMKLSF